MGTLILNLLISMSGSWKFVSLLPVGPYALGTSSLLASGGLQSGIQHSQGGPTEVFSLVRSGRVRRNMDHSNGFDCHFMEAELLIPEYTVADLKQLPLRAIAVFAVRCARRVEHFATADHRETEALVPAVEAAIQMVEDFARGLAFTRCARVIQQIEAGRDAARGELLRERALAAVVRATHMVTTAQHALDLQGEAERTTLLAHDNAARPLARLADVAANLAALEALTSAELAAIALRYTNTFTKGATKDYKLLRRLALGAFPQAGAPLDPSPTGPLGPLWPKERSD
jgi:hypothetical protein